MNNFYVNPTAPIVDIQKDFPKEEFQYKVEKQKNNSQTGEKFSDYLHKALEEIDMEEDNVIKTPYKQVNISKKVTPSPITFNVNDDLTASYPGIESSVIKSAKGFFSYCFDDENGYCREFETLGECRKAARECSRQNPDVEISIYGMSSMHFINGKEQ